MALTTGLDPWSLTNIPDHLFDTLVVVWNEMQEAASKEKRRSDLRDRLRGATGR